MKPYQENKLRMYNACDTFLLSRYDILKILPSFEEHFKTFHTQFSEIQKFSEQESVNVTRSATTKRELKQNLAQLTYENSRKLHAFAHFANDFTLLNQTWLTESELASCTDSKLIDRARVIFDLASNYLRELTLYGITTTTQEAFRKSIRLMEASLQSHSKSLQEAGMVAGQIDQHYKTADQALIQIDEIIEIFRVSSPDLYKAYHESRKIMEVGPQPMAVKGKVFDAATNDPVPGVSILFVSCNNSFKQPPFLKYSADKGDFYVQSLEEGTYEIKLNKIGYKEVILSSSVQKGEICQITTKMYRV